MSLVPSISTAQPVLISPPDGAILDNGCAPPSPWNDIVRNFAWAPVPQADLYNLYVKRAAAAVSMFAIDVNVTGTSYHQVRTSYIGTPNLLDWRWKVRARVGGVWGDFSAERTYDVEAVNLDCTQTEPTLSINDVTVVEGNTGTTSAVFTATLSAPRAETSSVFAITSVSGAATSGVDYSVTGPTLITFGPGVTTQTFAVPVLGDLAVEAPETFGVTLYDPANATIADGLGIATIVDDDTSFLSIDSPAVPEGRSARSILGFAVSLTAPVAADVTVNYATSDGTASAASDYVATSGVFTIPAGTMSKALIVLVQGDGDIETDETFTVTLSSPSGGAALGTSVGTGVIQNDDPATAATTTTQYRLYHDGTKEHLYTTDLNEYNVLGTVGWIQEGIAYKMLTNGLYNGVATVPLFRAYHPGILQHHWTTDSNEAATLSGTPFWFYEGTIGYLLPTQAAGSVPLYRMALASPPLHLWTTDLNEYNTLATLGWIKEGIIGYVVP